jgi:hypothetical protein
MAEFTISIPDTLAQRLEPLQDRLPELLSQLVEVLSPSMFSAERLSLVAQPTDAMLAYEEVLEFLLNRPTHEAVVAFKVSLAAQAHIRALFETRLWPIKLLTGHHESRDRELLAEIACTLPGE